MKLIRAFGIFVLISLIIGVGSAFNGSSSTSDESEIQEQSTEVVDVSFFESEEINKTTEEIIEEDVVEEIKDDESKKINNNEESKKEVVNKQNVSSVQSEVKEKVNKQEDTNSNSSITESKQEEINNNVIEEKKEDLVEEKNIQEETKSNSDEEIKSNDDEETIWEYLGISEYEYYNSPMLSWQKVTHSSFEECQNDGQEKIDNGEYEQYWCYQVNSYSGKMLGVMLKLS